MSFAILTSLRRVLRLFHKVARDSGSRKSDRVCILEVSGTYAATPPNNRVAAGPVYMG